MQEPASIDVQGEQRPEPPARRARMPLATILSLAVGVIGLTALGASAFVYSQTQRDVVRLATDIAQLRVSLELFGRQQGTPSGTDSASLVDLANRLAILEKNWRSAPTPAASLPAVPAPSAATAAAAGDDCLPTGTRFLVAAGDRYPVCGAAGTVEIGTVDNGFIALGDGTVIAVGGNIGLPDSACMIGVVAAGEVTGYAEIKVTC